MSSQDDDIRLIALMWRMGAMTDRMFISFTGQRVSVNHSGEYLSDENVMAGAEVVIDGAVSRGDVLFGTQPDLHDRAVLRVVSQDSIPTLDSRGIPLCQICIQVDDLLRERYLSLVNGASDCGCASVIGEMDDLHRAGLYTGLTVERMRRKADDIRKIFIDSDCDWSQTLYVMMMRSLGDNKNQEPFMEIARRVPFVTLMREKSSVKSLEALLLGMSGLLLEYDMDDYIMSLSHDFEYLCHKHSLRPLKPAVWNLGRVNPQNHPVMRLAEFAALVSRREFVFSNILECRTAEDVMRIFCCEATDYWQTHFLPGRESLYTHKKIGASKANLMGINLIAPFIFAYCDSRADEAGRMRALELLESLPVENNGIIKKWCAGGAVMRSAFDSQAVLQLNNEFCDKKLCDRCLVGRRQIKKSMMSLC